jgi:hypothetical protein
MIITRVATIACVAAAALAVGATFVTGDPTSEETKSVAEKDPCGCAAADSERTLTLTWERLLVDAETCPRCGATEAELDKAAAALRAALGPLGVAVVVEKRELAPAAFEADPSRSNRVWLNGRLLEDWLGGETGQSPCCDVCGEAECRTVEVGGEAYETIPADLIVRAGLAAAAALPGDLAAGPCCDLR